VQLADQGGVALQPPGVRSGVFLDLFYHGIAKDEAIRCTSKNTYLFLSAFPMFVPSLSWQAFGFSVVLAIKTRKKEDVSHRLCA
jgi:hypothetical protein